jgi:multicomponent Na+:H+ antiporter subunit B
MMRGFPIIRVVSKLIIPYIILFAFYVQFHGDYGPGGGFQAGVIFASAIILFGLVFGLEAAQRVIPPALVERLMAAGVLIYAATGAISMLRGGKFLEYELLEHQVAHQWLPTGQHLGIFLVELGVGITVTAVMITIFYAFAGRKAAA